MPKCRAYWGEQLERKTQKRDDNSTSSSIKRRLSPKYLLEVPFMIEKQEMRYKKCAEGNF